MNTELRLTVPVARVLAALVADPSGDHYGMELMQSSGLPSGTLYPILARLTEAGWLDKRWEDIDPSEAGRPARAYYRLTPAALPVARQRLAELHEQTRPAHPHVAAKEATA
ncbi:transcriptional regulator [Catellatospora methionotrophica]|uniref:Transcriptional regulator n=1 Tax=Catellatospora methionotrophica TaxID=121620 RepID=A0A8J3LCK4_9ACTN|nr:helix-turn-helix transcriptional regulator [Catellatospora methionotrophica]GIG12175.1 transcriptional regulator [Catellatospora methionotrophica]